MARFATFLPADFFTADFFAADFLADFLPVDFFAADFFATDFFAADFLAAFFAATSSPLSTCLAQEYPSHLLIKELLAQKLSDYRCDSAHRLAAMADSVFLIGA